MYTEALLVLVHNVASFPLESLWTIDVFIFVLDDQWCMISVEEEKERHREDSLLYLYLYFLKTWKEKKNLIFFLSNNHHRSFLFPYSETLFSIKLLIVFVYVDIRGECLSLIEQERREAEFTTTTCCRMAYNI
jgi:hypothetical protein